MTTLQNTDDNFDPMAESNFQPEVVSAEKYNEIKANGEKVKSFHSKYASIRAKYEAIFVDGIESEKEWSSQDASFYEMYKKEKQELPVDWNVNLYTAK